MVDNPKTPIAPVRPEKPSTERIDDNAIQGDSARIRASVHEMREGFVRLPPRLATFLQTHLSRMDTLAPQSFRLPGSDRMVNDRRSELAHKIGDAIGKLFGRHEEGKGKAAETSNENTGEARARELVVKEGRAHEAREKQYENYLGDRRLPFAQKEQPPVSKRPLSEFEEMIIKRFEKGAQVEKEVEEGKLRFLEKTVEQWRSFFEKFLNRMQSKTVNMSEVAEFLYRGLVKRGETKAVVISDLIHANGKVEKFIRFGIVYDKIGELLAKLMPGDVLLKRVVADGLATEKLAYLALLPPSIETEYLTGMKPKQGIFAAESTEARVAEELGIARDDSKGGLPLTAERKERELRLKKRGGLFKRLSGDEEAPDSGAGQFIPWWQWGTLGKPGGLKIKRAFYTGVFVIFILTVLFLIHQFL